MNICTSRFHTGNRRNRKPIPTVCLVLSLLLALVIHPSILLSQDFEEWLRQEQQQFEDFRAEQNRAFANMLREQWEAMQGIQPGRQLEEDKPAEIPVAPPVEQIPEPDQPDEDRTITDDPPPTPPSPVPPPAPSPPPPRDTGPDVQIRPPEPEPGVPAIDVSFFGLTIQVPYDSALTEIEIPESYNAESITAFWEAAMNTEIDQTVTFYEKIQEQYRINDWGLARLMFSAGKEIFDKHRDQARLYTWFMLIQNGYKARVGFNDNGIRLMIASDAHIYGTPFYRFDEIPFFLAHFDNIPGEPERLFTYASDFPGDLIPLSLRVPATPLLPPDYSRRNLTFEYQGETFEIEIDVNENLVAYYEFFPQTDLGIYFNAPVKETTSSGLVKALSEQIEGRSETDAVHLLLRFVQTAFGYKIDPDNFGREKPLFAEETIYYDYSDCEDRAILFAFLVRELTGLDVVGLRYPGHIAAAVRFNESLSGDIVEVDGVTYHVCDPTYINAGPGMAMSRFQNTVPAIIPLEP